MSLVVVGVVVVVSAAAMTGSKLIADGSLLMLALVFGLTTLPIFFSFCFLIIITGPPSPTSWLSPPPRFRPPNASFSVPSTNFFRLFTLLFNTFPGSSNLMTAIANRPSSSAFLSSSTAIIAGSIATASGGGAGDNRIVRLELMVRAPACFFVGGTCAMTADGEPVTSDGSYG